MTGRLELDDDGRVVGASDVPVDLGPVPEPTRRDPGPVARVVGPVLRRHRRRLLGAAAVLVAAAVAISWWSGRPPDIAPVVALELSTAVLAGNSIGGPEVSPDGLLQVAFAAQAPAGTTATVTGLTGPGLGPSTIEAPILDDSGLGRVEASARLDCADPALRTAQPRDYGLQVTATTATGRSADGIVGLTRTLPGGRDITRLNLAVADWCLGGAAVEVLGVTATPVPGIPLADLEVRVRNTATLPVLVATERWAGADVELDLSADVAVNPGEVAVLATRAFIHDCTAVPRLSPVAELPNPSGDGAGITLVLRTGGTYALRSVPVPGAADLGRRLGATLCADAPAVSVAVTEVRRVATTPGSWRLRATVDVRTEGVGIRVGREHFVGPAAGAGSFLGVVDDGTPDSPWEAAPARLDGGAGRLDLDLPGGRCADLAALSPGSLALRVLTADGRVFPFEVPLDDVRLVAAAYAGCAAEPAPANVLLDRGWPKRLLRLPGGITS